MVTLLILKWNISKYKQQIEKYETGENQISIEKLAIIAKIFHVEMWYFFAPDEE